MERTDLKIRTFSLYEDIMEMLRELARDADLSMSQYLRRLIKNAYEKSKGSKGNK